MHVFERKRHIPAHIFCKPASRDTTAGVCPGKWWQPRGDKQPASPLCRMRTLRKSEKGTKRSYQVSGKYSRKRTKREREGLGFQERHTVISKCFFALSGCLTKAAGEFYWRIRLVAFLWLLTSGGFGLCLESQWSNRHVCHFVEQSIDCGRGNNAFFSGREGLFMLRLIILHLWLQFDVLYRCHRFGSTAEECTWGFTWAHGRKVTCWFILKSHQQSFSIYHPTGFIRSGPQIF